MNVIWHFIVNAVLSLLFSIGVLAVVNAILLLSGRANPRQVRFALRIRRALQKAVPDVMFECQGRRVSTIRYNYETDRDEATHVYTANYVSPLAWRSGRLITAEVRRRATMEIAISASILLFIIAPLCAACAWLAVTRWWPWWLAVAIVVTAQAATAITGKFVITWNRMAVSGIFAIFFLHRYNAFSSSLLLAFDTVWLIASLALLVWMEKLD
jgi:hypothetical protein